MKASTMKMTLPPVAIDPENSFGIYTGLFQGASNVGAQFASSADECDGPDDGDSNDCDCDCAKV